MASLLLDKWLRYYDPVHRGGTPAGLANGMPATNGFAFPRIRGGYNLRRAGAGVPDEQAVIVGAAGADSNSIGTFPWVEHRASTTYTYRITSLSGGGAENLADEVRAEASFDETGAWIGRRPNAPGELRASAGPDGVIYLSWTYNPEGEQVEPASFAVYDDGGTGILDFSSPSGSVACQRGRFHYGYESGPFPHDTPVRFAVRAVSAEGVDDGNVRSVEVRAQSAAPPAPEAVIISCEAY